MTHPNCTQYDTIAYMGLEQRPRDHRQSSSIMGGSNEDIESPEAARKIFEHFLTRKWNKRKDEKELSKTLKEVNQLRRLYPELWEEVFEERLERARRAWEEKYNRPW